MEEKFMIEDDEAEDIEDDDDLITDCFYSLYCCF